jgi:hypothetical protein
MITGERQKKPPLPTARITTTLIDWQATKIGGPPKPPQRYFNIFLHMRPLFYGKFADFTILCLQLLYLYPNDNMYWEYKVGAPMYSM